MRTRQRELEARRRNGGGAMRTLIVAFAMAICAACVPPFDAQPPSQITSGPTIRPLGNFELKLVHVLDVTTAEPTTLTVVLDGGDLRRQIVFPGLTETHSVPLLGLLENTSYTTTVVLRTKAGHMVTT